MNKIKAQTIWKSIYNTWRASEVTHLTAKECSVQINSKF